MLTKMKFAFALILIVALAFLSEHGNAHRHHGYLYINVRAAGNVEKIGQDDIGGFTDYWVYGSTSLSTPSDIEDDNDYSGRCKQVLFVGLEAPHNKITIFRGETFIGKALSGTVRIWTDIGGTDTTLVYQEAAVFYDVNGIILRTDHDHSASITVPPGGSSYNEPW